MEKLVLDKSMEMLFIVIGRGVGYVGIEVGRWVYVIA